MGATNIQIGQEGERREGKEGAKLDEQKREGRKSLNFILFRKKNGRFSPTTVCPSVLSTCFFLPPVGSLAKRIKGKEKKGKFEGCFPSPFSSFFHLPVVIVAAAVEYGGGEERRGPISGKPAGNGAAAAAAAATTAAVGQEKNDCYHKEKEEEEERNKRREKGKEVAPQTAMNAGKPCGPGSHYILLLRGKKVKLQHCKVAGQQKHSVQVNKIPIWQSQQR